MNARRLRRLSLIALLASLLAGCGTSTGSTGPGASTSSSASRGRFDAMAVLGHSGTTGYNSDPDQPGADVPENSWATGTNPAVDSLYLRLLAGHPGLKGHAFHHGLDGSGVDDLPRQIDEMLDDRPLPDLVVIQSIDNDIACDGTDPQNYGPYATKLRAALATIVAKDPGARIFLVDQWASGKTFATVVATSPPLVQRNTGSGPCDLFSEAGTVRPDAVRYLQGVVDAYFARIEQVCAAFPQCSTDHGLMQTLDLALPDLVVDGNHLAVSGQAKMAALAWQALPADIKAG